MSLDEPGQANTAIAVTDQIRDLELDVQHQSQPGSTFWNNWTKYPFSTTEWNGRPLGIQVLSRAYRGGAAWHESSYTDPEFDAALDEALASPGTDARAVVMARLQAMLREDGVIIQPYWRKIYRSVAEHVQGFDARLAFEQHLDKVSLS